MWQHAKCVGVLALKYMRKMCYLYRHNTLLYFHAMKVYGFLPFSGYGAWKHIQ